MYQNSDTNKHAKHNSDLIRIWTGWGSGVPAFRQLLRMARPDFDRTCIFCERRSWFLLALISPARAGGCWLLVVTPVEVLGATVRWRCGGGARGEGEGEGGVHASARETANPRGVAPAVLSRQTSGVGGSGFFSYRIACAGGCWRRLSRRAAACHARGCAGTTRSSARTAAASHPCV
jgi:hypothetical protein